MSGINSNVERRNLNICIKIFVFVILIVSYMISPFIALFVSFICLGILRKSLFVSLVAGFSLAYPAFFYIPLTTDDASRILYIVHDMQTIPFDGLHQWLTLWASDYLNYPIFTGLMYFVARNFQDTVLPFIVAGVTYTVLIYLVLKFSNVFNLSLIVTYLTVISSVLWLSYLELISGMRFTLACTISLIIICDLFVFDVSTKRFRYLKLLWFIIPMLIHPGVILVLAPLFIILLMRLKNDIWKFFLIILSILSILFILSGFGSQFNYVIMLRNRFTSYQTTSFGYLTSPQHIIHFCIGFIMGCIATFELRYLSKFNLEKNLVLKKLYRLVLIYTLYFFVTVVSVSFGMRLVMVMPILFIFGISAATSKIPNKNGNKTLNIVVLIGIIISGFIYNLSFFNIEFYNMHFFLFN